MELSRKTKIWIGIASIPAVLLIGAVIALKLFFAGDRLKAMILPRVAEATHRSVAIGQIHLSLFPAIAVAVDSLSIANATGEGFSRLPLFSLDKLTLRVRVLPLFRGALEITTVTLQRPRLLIEYDGRGVPNYAGLGPGKVPAGDEPPPGRGSTAKGGTGAAGFLLSNLQIINGSVDYVDWKGNSATRIEGLNAALGVEAEKTETGILLEGEASIDKLSYGTVTTPLLSNLRMTLDEQVVYDRHTDVLRIQKGTLTVQDMILAVSGGCSALTATPVLDLRLQSDRINIADLLSLVPREYMNRAAGLKGNGIARILVSITGSVTDSTNPDLSGSISATNTSLQYAQLPKPITNISIVSSFLRTKRMQRFDIEKFTAMLGNSPVEASLAVVDFDDPSLMMKAKGSIDLAEVREYYPLEQGTELTGTLSVDVAIAGKVKDPAALNASGSMEFRNVTVKTPSSPNPLRSLQGSIRFNNEVIESKALSLMLGTSDLSLAFTVRNYLQMVTGGKPGRRPSASLTLTSAHFATADLMPDGSGTAGAPGGVPSAKKQRVGMPLPGVDMDVSASIGTFTMKKFEFKNVRTTMRIADGIISMSNFSLNAFDGSVVARGVLSLQKPEQPLFDLAMDLNKIDAHALLPHFTSFGERLFGRLTMSTVLKGALNDTLGLVPQSLNGQGSVRVESGQLTGMKVNKAVAEYLKLPDLENITFKDWSNAFTVAGGRMVIKDLKITAVDGEYVVNGSQGLDGSMDYSMALILPEKAGARASIPGFAGEAVNLFRDESGRVRLDFNVRGTMDAPTIALDSDRARKKGENLVREKVNDEAKKLQDQLKGKVDKTLKDLFKKK